MTSSWKKLAQSMSVEQRESLRKLLRMSLSVVPHRHRLDILALKHGTDKRGHGYLEHYQRRFGRIRTRKMRVLEIGVGGYDDPRAGGASLRMWRDFFPNSMIYSVDIFDKSPLQERRIRIFRGSQNDPLFLEKVAAEIGPLDIIIDDGSHVSEHIRTSFETLFPHLVENGTYAIEDLYTSYWPSYGGSFDPRGSSSTAMEMLKSLADGLNYQLIPKRTPGRFDRDIASIEFHPCLAFVLKGRNERAIAHQFTRQAAEEGGAG